MTLNHPKYHSIISYFAIFINKKVTTCSHIMITIQEEMWLTPIKTWLQVVKKLPVTFHVACHVRQVMTLHNYITRQQTIWLHIVTCQINFFFSTWVGERRSQTPKQIKTCPTCFRMDLMSKDLRKHSPHCLWCTLRKTTSMWTKKFTNIHATYQVLKHMNTFHV